MKSLTVAVLIITAFRAISAAKRRYNKPQKTDALDKEVKLNYFCVKSGGDAVNAFMKFESNITGFLVVVVNNKEFEDMSDPFSESNAVINQLEERVQSYR